MAYPKIQSDHENFIDKQELNFPLLMDEDGAIHEAFGTENEEEFGKNTWVVQDLLS